MKVELELLLFIIIVCTIVAFALYFLSPNVDSYWGFSMSKLIENDPSILVRKNYTVPETRFVTGGLLLYPMPIYILLVPFIAIGAEKLFFIILFLALMLLMWKWEKKAIPFLALSFMLLRVSVFGSIDMFVAVLAIACIYFFERKPFVSGVFAGIAPLIKGTGFMILLGYIIALLLFKRKDVKAKKLIAYIAIALIIASIWYTRNLIFLNGDLIGAITYNSNTAEAQQFLNTDFQLSQPERALWDNTGYYPLPIDILLYLGLFFTIFNIYKSRKISPEHIFILIALGAYFSINILNLTFLKGLRYYLFIFPFLAVQISRGLSERHLKYSYILAMVIFIFFMLNIPKYAWNAMGTEIQSSGICLYVKSVIGGDTVYVKAFQDLFFIWECKLTLQSALEEQSTWTLDLYNGDLYKTNLTNSTGVTNG